MAQEFITCRLLRAGAVQGTSTLCFSRHPSQPCTCASLLPFLQPCFTPSLVSLSVPFSCNYLCCLPRIPASFLSFPLPAVTVWVTLLSSTTLQSVLIYSNISLFFLWLFWFLVSKAVYGLSTIFSICTIFSIRLFFFRVHHYI